MIIHFLLELHNWEGGGEEIVTDCSDCQAGSKSWAVFVVLTNLALTYNHLVCYNTQQDRVGQSGVRSRTERETETAVSRAPVLLPLIVLQFPCWSGDWLEQSQSVCCSNKYELREREREKKRVNTYGLRQHC